jgi:hypothetical protein
MLHEMQNEGTRDERERETRDRKCSATMTELRDKLSFRYRMVPFTFTVGSAPPFGLG